MSRYRQVVRFLFAVIFIGGGIAHFVMGRTMPDGYAVFGDTALIPGLGAVWDSFVMPNIGWLTILTGIFEVWPALNKTVFQCVLRWRLVWAGYRMGACRLM